MSLLHYTGIGIRGLAAAVPANVVDNLQYTAHFPATDVADVVEKTGILQRRFAPEGMCASDLCFAAAEQLLADLHIDRSQIDLLVFVSQTPDYRMPATAITLQHRLGLGTHVAAFDVSLGCSGFVYGLSLVYSFMQQQGMRKALLLDGETRSRVYSPRDRKTAFLFGDAGAAALIERDDAYGESFFSLQSDGSRASLIKVDAGGYRKPSSPHTLREQVVDQWGNIRSEEHGYMHGPDVFNFVIREIPPHLQQLLAAAGKEVDNIDHFVLHQANAYMNNYLAKKLRLPPAKVPSSVARFGNTSSVSIPLTTVDVLQATLSGAGNQQLLLSGFGVGMSWASAIINWAGGYVAPLIELAD